MNSSSDSAVGVAPAKVDVIELLNDKRRSLNAEREKYAVEKQMRDEDAMANAHQRIDALKLIITELEREAAVEVEAAGRKAAEDRLLGIKRAAGSVRAELKEDDARVRKAEKELNEVNAKRTARARSYENLQAEANALSDRFDLPPVKLEVVPEPQSIEVPRPWEYRVKRPSFETCEHGLRTRRDFTELSGSIGYSIIQTAGLKAFRPLTAQEKAVLEDKAEWKPDAVLAAEAVVANAPRGAFPGGTVHSG